MSDYLEHPQVKNTPSRPDAKHPGFDSALPALAMTAAEIGMWDLDLHTDRALVCANASRLLGLPPQEHDLAPKQWRSRIVPDDLGHVEAQIKRTCSTGEHFSVEFRVQHDSGKIVWLQGKGQLTKYVDGRPTRLVGITLDITARKQAENALRESEARFRLLADASPDGIYVNCAGRFVYANRAAARMLGVEQPRDLRKFTRAQFVDPALLASVEKQVLSELEHCTTTKAITVPLRRLDSSEVSAELTYGRITWQGKEALQILVRDVTEQRRAEQRLRVVNERLKLAVEGSGEGIWDYDLISDKYELSGNVNEVVGYPKDNLPRDVDEWRSIIHHDDLARVDSAMQACRDGASANYRCEYRIRARDGSWRWVFSRAVVVARDEHGKPTAMTGTITDVTAKRESEEVIWRHANLDPLTELPNRRHFLDNIETELRRAPRSAAGNALLFIDLDGFKQVNDLFGHDAGDLLLMETAHRIQHTIRETDCLARLGGDEFTVLLKDLHDAPRVEFVCQAILAALSRPFVLGNESAYVSASIGVAFSPMDAVTADELLRKADTAMYSAKSAGKDQFCYFAQSMDDRAHMRLRVSTELRRAIPAKQLHLCYQPVIDLHDGHVVKTEALLRWDHPKLGAIEPALFIPIAEEAGLMADIGNWVFREAAAQTKRWGNLLGAPFKVALNKSPVQFSRRYAESHWLHYLAQLGLPPSSVVVEITEGLLLNASKEVNDKLLEYRDAGIQVAIDDFGTGYSSMAYLKEFDIDYLKIDQSFVRGIPANVHHCTIAETIIVMAHKLGQRVIAEGIETKEQADFLAQAGCDYGQGFYFAAPLPADQVEGLLSRRYL